jgi:hypothetical protein
MDSQNIPCRHSCKNNLIEGFYKIQSVGIKDF